MKLYVLSVFLLVRILWFILAMKSFFCVLNREWFRKENGLSAGRWKKALRALSVKIHELPVLGQRSPGITLKTSIYFAFMGLPDQNEHHCPSLHYWSSPIPVKFGYSDWKCWDIALILFSHWFFFDRSFNLVQVYLFLPLPRSQWWGQARLLLSRFIKAKITYHLVGFCKVLWTVSSHSTKSSFPFGDQGTFALYVQVLT